MTLCLASEDQSQVLVFARQALYPLSHPPQPLFNSFQTDIFVHFCARWSAIEGILKPGREQTFISWELTGPYNLDLILSEGLNFRDLTFLPKPDCPVRGLRVP